MLFVVKELPNDLPDGIYMSEVLSAEWVKQQMVVTVRYAPERTECLLPIVVNRGSVHVDTGE